MQQTTLFDASEFFESEADYAQFLSRKGEVRHRREVNSMTWDFEFFWYWTKPENENGLFFWEFNDEVIVVGHFDIEKQTVSTILRWNPIGVLPGNFMVRQINVSSNGSVFIDGSAYESYEIRKHYLLHLTSEAELLTQFEQIQKDDYQIALACFSERLQTVFVWHSKRKEMLKYNTEKNRFETLFAIQNVDAIVIDADALMLLTPNAFVIAPLENASDFISHSINRDIYYPTIAVSFHDNTLTLVQPFEEMGADIQGSWMDSYYGGIFRYDLTSNGFRDKDEILFKGQRYKDAEFATIDVLRDRIVLFDPARSRLFYVFESMQQTQEMNWGGFGKNLNLLHFDKAGNLWAGNSSKLCKITF